MGMLASLMTGVELDPRNWPGMIGSASRRVTSGVTVNHKTALNYSACWAATRLLTETIATLPNEMYRRLDGRKSAAVSHPTYRPFCTEPNPRQGSVNYLAQQFGFMINWGNCYAEVVRDGNGRVTQQWPIHPSRIPDHNIRRNPEGTLTYFVMNNGGQPTEIPQRDMFHVAGVLCEDDVCGKGVIPHGAESIGMGLATEQYGASHFGNGGGPSIVMTHPNKLGDEGQNNIRRSWHKRYNGPDKANGFLILEEGATVEHLSFPPEANQFLATRQFNITEIARWYNLPPHMLRELSKSSFNNIESESLHFVIISIMPWLVRYEKECARQLLLEEEQPHYYFKFLLQGLLRGDMASRAAFCEKMFQMGVFSTNDIRELEDMNSIGPDGDRRFVSANVLPLDAPRVESATPAKIDTPAKQKQSPASQDDTDAEATIIRATMATAAQSVLTATISGLIWYEGRKAIEKARDPRTFEAWCNAFYNDKFATQFAQQVQPMLAASTLFGTTTALADLTASHCNQSRRDLLALLDTPFSDFAAAVQLTVNQWESRASSEAAGVFTSRKESTDA